MIEFLKHLSISRLEQYFLRNKLSKLVKEIDKDIAHFPTKPLTKIGKKNFKKIKLVYRIAKITKSTTLEARAFYLLSEYENYRFYSEEKQKKYEDKAREAIEFLGGIRQYKVYSKQLAKTFKGILRKK